MADQSVPRNVSPEDRYSLPADPSTPDYELDDVLELTEPVQYKALFEDTRTEIVSLLLERAATTSELAEALGKPKGTIGHHLHVLAAAGLVRVVRTKRVRALEAKYYGRTARVFLFHKIGEASSLSARTLATAADEIAAAEASAADPDREVMANRRYARIPDDRADAWAIRIQDELVEFASEPRGGDTTYAMVVALYPTNRAPLPTPEEDV
jgi:DNA-binding transcriptional ArsR family regulator